MWAMGFVIYSIDATVVLPLVKIYILQPSATFDENAFPVLFACWLKAPHVLFPSQAKSETTSRPVVAAAKPATSMDVDEEYNSDASGV